MAACESQGPEGPSGGDAIVRFGVGEMSRAESTTNNNITESPFAIYGEMSFATKTRVFDGTPVTYNPSADAWTYGEAQYWFPKHEHSFVALHPYGAPTISDYNYSDGRLELKYTYPADYMDATDALIAAHRRRIGEDAGSGNDMVRFSFAHILTNVNVLVSYSGPSSGPTHIRVDRMTIKNIPTVATYGIRPAPLTGGSTSTYDWTNDESSYHGWTVDLRGDVVIDFPASGGKERVVETNSDSRLLFGEGDELLLLPNPDYSAVPAEVELTYTTSKGETEQVWSTIPRGWAPGTGMTLSLAIDNGTVQFGISIGEWEQGTTSGTVVPR